jgi:two-component system cell cycle sensor histidine kinase/response regulator CckA
MQERQTSGVAGLRKAALARGLSWVRSYMPAIAGLILITIPTYLVQQSPPPHNPLVGAVLVTGMLVLILGSAWLGYGPGLLICALLCFAVPQFVPQAKRAFQVHASQFLVLSFVSVLVSRVADVGRKHRAALSGTADALEEKVQQRTAELTEALKALGQQARFVELAHDAIMAMDMNGVIQFWSAGAERMYGWSKQEALGQISHDLLQTKFSQALDAIERQVRDEGHWEGELQHVRRDGTKVRVLSRWAFRPAADGEPPGILEINTDITEHRKIEEQLRNTQRLESIGVLAGGVAHDFNNLLTGMIGNTSLALDSMLPSDPKYVLIEDALRAAERASDLTRQLLAYAGKGRYVLQVIDLSALVRDISKLVTASIPKTVQLRLQLADDLPAVEADAGQLQQVVMNLIINGAEAIGPEGGTVLVQTGAQDIDELYIGTLSTAGQHLRAGSHVLLQVHDTGCGMDAETIGKIFEPFFTTKFTGRGLGLSAVQGIVQGHRGALKIYSKPGQGTTFKVLLPSAAAQPQTPVVRRVTNLAGNGRVLVVDDEDIVRRTAVHTLKQYGYDAIVANNGAEALELFKENPHGFAAILLDLTMPVMGGEETLRQMRTLHPGIRVVLSSGYNEVEAIQRFTGKGLAGFLQKPYTSVSLAQKLRDVLH